MGKITKEYMCPSPIIREDTTSTDSLMEMPMDTTAAPVSVPATEENPENKPPATK
jgi:penicillin-binding protein 1A